MWIIMHQGGIRFITFCPELRVSHVRQKWRKSRRPATSNLPCQLVIIINHSPIHCRKLLIRPQNVSHFPNKDLMGFGGFSQFSQSSMTSHGLERGWFIHSLSTLWLVVFISALKAFPLFMPLKINMRHWYWSLKKKLRCSITQSKREWEKREKKPLSLFLIL